MKHILFLLLFNILSFVSLQSQPSCVFTQYTTKDGLIQKTISYILQDRKRFYLGYLPGMELTVLMDIHLKITKLVRETSLVLLIIVWIILQKIIKVLYGL